VRELVLERGAQKATAYGSPVLGAHGTMPAGVKDRHVVGRVAYVHGVYDRVAKISPTYL
jgi:hypothetical protein